jgi:hypothetical protein
MGRFLILLLVMFLFHTPDSFAQTNDSVVGRLGIGASGSFSFPMLGMKDRFNAKEAYGLYLTYAKSSRQSIEVEYRRTVYDPGKVEQATFFWPEDKPTTWQRIKSPLARNFMTINSYTVNGLYHFVDRAPSEPEGLGQKILGGPFITYGAGFYHYTNQTSGLIFAGQPDLGNGIDNTLFLEPLKETDVGWGFNAGLGVEVLVNDRAAIDVRSRWHLMIGELRQMESYGVARTWPLGYFEIGLSMKYYIM